MGIDVAFIFLKIVDGSGVRNLKSFTCEKRND